MEYHVSPQGDDGHAGTAEAPFRTLARAGAVVTDGDSCVVHGGVYREVLRPESSGSSGEPIVYRAHDGETPTILGTEPLADWRHEADGQWSAPMPADLGHGNQVFAGDRPLSEARWPNDSGDLLQPRRAQAKDGTATTLTDPALSGEADCWAGATLWCAGGHRWICWAGTVTGYDPDTKTLTFDSTMAATHWYTPKAESEYVLMGARAALDSPGEWWLDGDSRRLWLIPPEGRAPASLGIEVKARQSAIDLTDRQHIHLIGLHFRGGGLRTDEASQHLRLEGLRGEYVAHCYQKDASADGVVIDGAHHVVVGCEFAFSSGSVVQVRGCHHKLLGNCIHHGNYGGLWSGTLSLKGRRHVVAHNTVRHSGRDLVSVHGLMESLVEHNDLSHAGWLTQDLGITYGHDTDFAGTVIRRNWVHDCVSKGLAEGIYFDHCSHNVIVTQNLIWNIPGMPIQVNNPGHYNLIAHNSCYRTSTARDEITSFDHSHRQDLSGCHFTNNLVNGRFNLPDNAEVNGNLVTADPGYSAPGSGDFSLRPDSPARGAACPIPGMEGDGLTDPGAVPFGEETWRAGHEGSGPLDEAAEWTRPDWAHTNRLANGTFEIGTLEGWEAMGGGSVEIVKGNGWGNKVVGTEEAPTGTSHHELQLAGPVGVEQTVAELPASTQMRLSAWVRAGGPGAPVVVEVRSDGASLGRTQSAEPEWRRVVVEFCTGANPGPVLVQVRQDAGDDTHRARIDNLGLIEAD